MALDLLQTIVDQRRAVQPLTEQPSQILARDFLAHGAEGLLVHVLQLPARVVAPQDAAHRLVAHHVAQLLVEQLRLGVDHGVVRGEVTEALADHGHGLAPAVEVEVQDVRLDPRVGRPGAVGLEVPARLEAGEALVEKPLAPLVVGENAHRVVMAHLVQDQAEPGAAVHHHHRELGPAALDAVHVGQLRPGERPVQRVEPGERRHGAADRYSVPPGLAILRLVQHAHHHGAVTPLFIDVLRVEREGEMVDIFGEEAHAFPPFRLPAPGTRGPGPVPFALVIDPQRRVGLRALPPGISLDRYARRADHLVGGQVQRHVVRRELAVELARGIERVRFPTVPVVHHNLGVPLREVEAPPLPSLTPWQRRGPRLPVELQHQRVPRGERPRQRPVRHRRIGREGIAGHHDRRARHPRRGDPFEGVVRILEVLEPLPAFRLVRCRPARPGSERVEILVHVEVPQCVRRAVHVGDALVPRQRAAGLVERGGDLVADLLLPIAAGVGRREKKQQREHGTWKLHRPAQPGEARARGTEPARAIRMPLPAMEASG